MKSLPLIILAAAIATTTPAWGRQLTPDEALASVKTTAIAKVKGTEQFRLAYTVSDSDLKGVYVFNSGEGFLVAAADDAAGISLMGYADNGTFDPANIPPSMRWWLDNAARYIGQVARGEKAPTPRAKAPMYYPISPICTTRWNQGDPYNMYCPVVNGQLSVTGCVATAMAQVMKAHDWPKTGKGSKNFIFGGKADLVDFGATTYDWGKMPNDLYSFSPLAERQAVATLMYHCGVASDMNYSPSGSGTSDFTAGMGLVNYLRYSPSMTYQQRDWYTADDWDALVYKQLVAGNPVMYAGNDGQVGHAFVCDGYSTSGYFHINWGWGGLADGYFLLADLNPYSQGIGGGSGQEGFNYGQSILIDMVPATEGDTKIRPNIMIDGAFIPARRNYDRNANTEITLEVAMYSFALGTVDYVFGLECMNDAGESTYVEYLEGTLKPLTGYGEIPVATTDLPVGSYDVFPVCRRVDSDEWFAMNYMPEVCEGSFHLDVTDTHITVSGEEAPYRVRCDFTEFEGVNPDDEELYSGHSYDVRGVIDVNRAITASTNVVLIDSKKNVAAESAPLEVVITDPDGGVVDKTWRMDIPATLAAGRYTLGLRVSGDGESEVVMSQRVATVYDDPAYGTGTCVGVTFIDSPTSGVSSSKAATLGRGYGQAKIIIECSTAPFNEQVYGIIADVATGERVCATAPEALTIDAVGERGFVIVSGFNDVELDKVYLFIPASVRKGEITSKRKYYVKFIDDSGVVNIEADQCPAEYFTPQGIRVASPTPGHLYIKRQGSTITKELTR